MRILIVKLSSMGDVIHVTPCVRALRRARPDAEILAAVDAPYADLLRRNPHLNGLVESHRVPGGPLAAWRQIGRDLDPFLREPFDLAIDFQGTWRSALWVYASRARVKAGRGKWRPGWQTTVEPDLSRHAVRVCADIAERVGVAVDNLNPELFTSEEDDRAVLDLLKRHGLPEPGYIVFNPFSRWPSKTWPAERYAEVAARVQKEKCVPIVITGGPGEEAQAAELLKLMPSPGVVSLAGQLTLGQSLCLFKRAPLMLTGDSGPMHAAAALGVRVVALFGPTLPERTGPWGEKHVVIQASRPAQHREYRTDDAGVHIRAIETETVCKAVLAALG